MRVLHEGLREAVAAVEFARRRFTGLDPRGPGPHDSCYAANQHSFDNEYGLAQIETAIAFLSDSGLPGSTSSYAAKHQVEQWGRLNGMAPYVSNGATIVAACYLGMKICFDRSGNVLLG